MPMQSPDPAPAAAAAGLNAAERALCDAAIRHGSKSFHAASCLLPGRMRCAARALYAFCRASDDLIDETQAHGRAAALRGRLDRIYAGAPGDAVEDRAFAAVARAYRIPQAIPAALIEGFEWDEQGRSYRSLDDLLGYAARVAGTVGVMMSLLMGRRSAPVLARAADLGLAMQLTNIARDVGEDARRGRIYLPLDWLAEAGVAPERLLAAEIAEPEVRRVTARLLRVADRYYARAWTGIGALPVRARPAIGAAAAIYRDIGRVISLNAFDSVSQRAQTGAVRKCALIAHSTGAVHLCGALDGAPADAAVAFLIEAVEETADPMQMDAEDGNLGRFLDLLHTSALRRNAMAPTPAAGA